MNQTTKNNKLTSRRKGMLTYRLTFAAAVAALYVLLTFLSAAFSLASGPIQIRLSEALTILPYFSPASIPGLAVGCLLSNLLLGAPVPDIIFGSLATLLGASFAYLLRRSRFLVPIPTILSNMLIIPLVLRYAYGVGDAMWYLVLTVGAGEVISAFILGELLLVVLRKQKHLFVH